MADLISFSWRVPETGFEWIEARPEGGERGQYLAVRSLPPSHVQYCPYNPLDETGLFREFGEVFPTFDGVLAFAGKFGFLGSDPTHHRVPSVVVNRSVDTGSVSWSVHGETLDSWAVEVHAMRETVALWDAIKGKTDGNYGDRPGPAEYLDYVIHWTDNVAVSYKRPAPDGRRFGELFRRWPRNKADNLALFDSRFQIVSETADELFKRFTPGDRILPAQYALQRIIRSKLRTYASTADLLWDWTRHRPDLRIQLVPTCLIAAMWLQFAAAIDGDRDYRRCDACKRWFEISRTSRVDAKFCKQSCRFKAYRQRQQRARELASKGMNPQAIAREIDSDLITVKGWLKK